MPIRNQDFDKELQIYRQLSIILFLSTDLIKKLRKDHEGSHSEKGRGYYKSYFVIMDEVGYTPINREDCNLFFRFVANR